MGGDTPGATGAHEALRQGSNVFDESCSGTNSIGLGEARRRSLGSDDRRRGLCRDLASSNSTATHEWEF